MLNWRVYIEDFNDKEIKTINIFQNKSFVEACKQSWEKHKDDKNAFAEAVRHELAYWYRWKCEWEIVLHSWPPREDFNAEKIDVFDQIMLNFDVFIEYLINHIKEL